MLFTIAFSTSVLLSSPYAAAGADHPPRPVKNRTKAWKEALAKPSLAVTAAFDRSGRLWRASLKDGRVLVSASDDLGKTFGPPVPANVEPETIIGDGENRHPGGRSGRSEEVGEGVERLEQLTGEEGDVAARTRSARGAPRRGNVVEANDRLSG